MRAFAPQSISAPNMGGAGRGLRGGVSRGERPDVEVTYTWTTDPARPYGYAEAGNQIALEGPLLCYPALEANRWQESARVILGLRGFELKRK